MVDQPFVSVVTPVYNGADFLQECIESVLNQTYQHFEYIIVNNRSTDRTLEIASAYAARDRRIRVHNNDRFVGVIENHNIGFSLISPQSGYCKVVSADDFIFPNYLTDTIELGEAHPSVGIIGSYQLAGNIIRWQGFDYPLSVIPGYDAGRRCFTQSQVFLNGHGVFGFGTPTSLLYRASLVRNSTAFYPNSSPHADTSACFEQLQKSDFGFVFKVLSYERIHAATQSSASIDLNRYYSAFLNDLLQYGAFYFTKEEFEQKRRRILDGYYRFLAVNYFVGFRDTAFWEYHESRLKELGCPLRQPRLLKAAIGAVLHGMANPAQMIETLKSRFSRKPTTGQVKMEHPGKARDVLATIDGSPDEASRRQALKDQDLNKSQPVRKIR